MMYPATIRLPHLQIEFDGLRMLTIDMLHDETPEAWYKMPVGDSYSLLVLQLLGKTLTVGNLCDYEIFTKNCMPMFSPEVR